MFSPSFTLILVVMALLSGVVHAGHNQGHGDNGNGNHYGHEHGVGHGGGGANNGGGSNNGNGNGNGNGNNDNRCYNGNGNANGQKDCDDYDNIICDSSGNFCDILDGLTVVKQSNLRFPSVVSGYSQVVSVAPSDSQSALFTIAGEPCMRVQVEVAQTADLMLANGSSTTDTIEVRDFTLGGAISSSGMGFIDCTTGRLTNIRVGGTAQVGANNKESFYEGFLTLRAWYY